MLDARFHRWHPGRGASGVELHLVPLSDIVGLCGVLTAKDARAYLTGFRTMPVPSGACEACVAAARAKGFLDDGAKKILGKRGRR